jgi:hypothetical protein
MKSTYLLSTLICAVDLLLVAPAQGAPPASANVTAPDAQSAAAVYRRPLINRRTGLFEPPLSDLRKAAQRGDRAELARTANRLGPARLAKALGDSDPRIVAAILDSLPLFPGGILVLENVPPLLSAADQTVREHALRATTTLLAHNDAASLSDWEITSETIQSTCRALATLSATEGVPVPMRLLAIQGLAEATRSCGSNSRLGQPLASPEAEVRRAAVLSVVADARASEILRAATRDSDLRVAAAAGARLCKLGLPTQTTQTAQTTQATQATQARPLRQLIQAGGAAAPNVEAAEDVVDMLPCLVSSKDPADAKALDDLQGSHVPAIRDAIKRLRENAAPAPSPRPETPKSH